MKTILARLSSLPSAAIYAFSAVIEKSFSFLTIPLMAAYLTPSEYGNYDIAVVAADLVVLVVGLGMAEQLIRFVSTAKTDVEQRVIAGEIMGCALVAAVIFTGMALVLSGVYADQINLQLEPYAFRIMLLGACLSSLIELPLAWLRLQDDAYSFLKFVLVRTFFQVASIIAVLTIGLGVEGLLVANGVILSISALWLTNQQLGHTPIRYSYQRVRQLARYGIPILGAMMCMYMLGNASRLFLAQHHSPEVIGNFGLATRFAMILAFTIYPLELWWLPKRIAALRTNTGLHQSAQVFGMAASLLLLATLGICVLIPVFIATLLPDGYAQSIGLLPWLTAVVGLSATAGLLEVGSYAREHGYKVVLIDLCAAITAGIGFLLLIPTWGAFGAIASMAIAQSFRITGYLLDGAQFAPINYPWRAIFGCCALTGALIALAPDLDTRLYRVAWVIPAAATLLAALFWTRLLRWPLPVTVVEPEENPEGSE